MQEAPIHHHGPIGKGFQKIQEVAQKRLNKNLNEIFSDPKEHKKEIDGEIFRILQQTTASPWRNRVISGKLAGQVGAFAFVGEHVPVPLAFVPVPFFPTFDLPHFGTVHGWPLTLSSLGTAFIYNLPNAVQAFSEHRFKKGARYLSFMALVQSHAPFVFNSFYHEFGNIPIERRHQIKFTEHLSQIMSADEANPQDYEVFEDAMKERVAKSLRRKDYAKLINRAERNEDNAQKELAKHRRKVEYHENILSKLPPPNTKFWRKLRAAFTKEGVQRFTHTALKRVQSAIEEHEEHRLQVVQFGRRMLENYGPKDLSATITGNEQFA